MNTTQDRSLTYVVLGVLVVGGLALIGYNLLLLPLLATYRDIDQQQQVNAAKQLEIAQIARDRVKLQHWRLLSLPGVENLKAARPGPRTPHEREDALKTAEGEYSRYLRDLLARHQIDAQFPQGRINGDSKSVPMLPGNVPAYTSMVFTVPIKATKLPNLVAFLEELQTAPLLHRIRGLTVKEAEGTGKASGALAAHLTVEALVVHGSAKRGGGLAAAGQPLVVRDAVLLAGRRMPTGLGLPGLQEKLLAAALLPRGRVYTDLARKNIFEGAPPPPQPQTIVEYVKEKAPVEVKPRETEDVITFAHLTDVTIASAPRASLYDRAIERRVELKLSLGSNWIPLLKTSDRNTVVRGKVVRIDTRGVTFHIQLKTTSGDEESPRKRFQRSDTIYEVPAAEVDALVKAKLVPASGWSVYKVDANYWGSMLRDRVVSLGRNRKDFAFRYDLVRGKVLKADDDWTFFAVPERYCSFTDGSDVPLPAHHGYCFLAVGQRLADGLRTPLPDPEVRAMSYPVIFAGTVVSGCSGQGSASAIAWGGVATLAGNGTQEGQSAPTATASAR